jgi:hypothetical protein
MGRSTPLPQVLLLAGYGLSYTLLMFILSAASLRRRDLV